ncbi:MAG: UPF0280 family protein [Candidatus Bathyarchaeota archaeon]|nr:UPF0280 family protein [Candidatus Bathyarchaeota archaeon]
MKSLLKESFIFKESRCMIIADKPEGIQAAKASIRQHRCKLEDYIKTNPKFFYSLAPVPVPRKPLIARLMAKAAEKANVGPMASVAGILADLAVKAMLRVGCKVAVVENGGEISAMANVPIDVAVAVGDTPLSKKFGFRLTEFPIGVATSSGRFSHALSFGDADAVTIFCKNAGLADAAATAVCNVVKGEDHQAAIQVGINKALSIQGVAGVLIIYRGFAGTAGKIPQIIKVNS